MDNTDFSQHIRIGTEGGRITSSTTKPVNTLFLHFSVKDKTLFVRRLAFLTKAGISVLESLTIIHTQTKAKRKQALYANIAANLSAGHSLATSLTPYIPQFGKFTINLIKTGEAAGTLPQNLIYISEELEKRSLLEQKIRNALIYPLFITISSIAVTAGLIVFIFPKILPILISLNVELPWTTKVLLVVGEFLSTYGLITIFGLIIATISIEKMRRDIPTVHYSVDWLLLHLPIAKSLTQTYISTQFCRTLSLSLKSGIMFTEALDSTADTTDNLIYKNLFKKLSGHVKQGGRISTILQTNAHLFPPMLPELIAIGETTGNLTNTLEHLSHQHEADVDSMTRNLSHAIEPLLLLLMGILVGIVAISVIAPIYEVTQHINTLR
jgi:type IV pilus assembly protein PilC